LSIQRELIVLASTFVAGSLAAAATGGRMSDARFRLKGPAANGAARAVSAAAVRLCGDACLALEADL
jgi:hypothetical protein